MLGSTLINDVNKAMTNTRKVMVAMCNNANRAKGPKSMIACVEVRDIAREDDGRMKCDCCNMTTIAVGAARYNEEHRRFLEEHVSVGHYNALEQSITPERGWENSSVVMKLKRIESDTKRSGCGYSIAVAALGGTREENTAIVNEIINGISNNG